MRSASAVRALEQYLRPKPKLIRRTCQKCDAKHTGPYLHCSVCLKVMATRHYAWMKEQRRRGLCTQCVEKQGANSTWRCPHHLEYDNKWQKARIEDQKAKGLCAWGRCQTPVDGYVRCEVHRAKAAAYSAKSAALPPSRRDLRRAFG